MIRGQPENWKTAAMSSPILVGYSPETSDRGPVDFAVAAARFTGAPLALVAVNQGGSVLDRLTGGEAREVPESGADDPFGSLRTELSGQDVTATFHVVEHLTAARGLADAIEELTPRLLVLGSSRRGHVGRVLPGSTAERLVHGAPCPVVVVPQGHTAPEGGLKTVGAAFVPTDEGRAALRAAALIARAAEAKLLAVMVLDPKHAAEQSPGLLAVSQREHDPGEDRHARDRLVAKDTLTAAIAAVAEGIEAERDVLYQDAVEGLEAASERMDLLVMGSRAYGPMRAVMLGGVSRRITTSAACPVLVLPRGTESDVDALLADAAAETSG
jgi:nucleotide-binding universal stress UspA family protein